ncbi:hypothetical protein ACJJTC_015066 [Scirpophaga incertulas]
MTLNECLLNIFTVAPAWRSQPQDVAALLGAPLRVDCEADGHPAPTITWYRKIGESAEGEQWQAVAGRLQAAAATRALAGTYRCVADNGVAAPLAKLVHLAVHEPPQLEPGAGSNVTTVRGRPAALACRARGDPPLDTHWSRRGARLDLHSYKWTITKARSADGGGVHTELRLSAASTADAGLYQCHAANHYGEATRSILLRVLEPPEAPRSLRLGGVGSRWVRLVWSANPAVGVYYSAIFGFLNPVSGEDTKQTVVNLTLENSSSDRLAADGYQELSARLDLVRPASTYSLKLVATNHVGQSPDSEPVLFTTLDEPPSASPQNVRVKAVDEDELHVTWSVCNAKL